MGNQTFLFLCPLLLIIPYLLPITAAAADKDGILNVYFVKLGWFWTSLISGLCIIRYSSFFNHWKRYISLTLWWVLFTQEVFGFAPLMDVIFLNSGGGCSFNVFDDDGSEQQLNLNFHDNEFRRLRGIRRMAKWLDSVEGSDGLKSALKSVISDERPTYDAEIIAELTDLSKKVRSSSGCATAGGHWIGGHDPSGHIFLITLMLMLMLGELSHYQNRAFKHLGRSYQRFFRRLSQHIIQLFDNSALVNIWTDQDRSQLFYNFLIKPPLNCYSTLFHIAYLILRYVVWENPILLLLTLTALWSYSFIVTVMVFHTFWEQLSGFSAAYLVGILVYKLF